MNLCKLSPRLACAASLIREGAYLADVGTDHAYLPISLCLDKKIRGGVVSDIVAGPIGRARKNISAYGLEDKLLAIMTDGLDTIDKHKPDDITILGMGGELIARIIDDAKWTRDSDINLCLQPMTHAELLRKYLYRSGFSIIDERLVKEEKIYQIILASFTGNTYVPTEEEALLGKINIERKGKEFEELCRHNIRVIQTRREGLLKAWRDTAYEDSLIKNISSLLEKGETL